MRSEGLQPLTAPAPPRVDEPPRVAIAREAHLVLGALAVAAVALAAAITIGASFGAYLYAPYSDAHDWAAAVFRSEQHPGWLDYLWLPHTRQRIPLARLVEWIDIEISRGRTPSFLWATLGLWSLGVGSLGWSLVRDTSLARTRICLGLLCGLLVSGAGLAEDVAFPVFSVYLFVAGPALAAVVLTADEGRLALGVALVMAVVTSFGNAAGLAVWPVLLSGVGLGHRRPAQAVAVLMVGAVVAIAVEARLGVPSTSLHAGGGLAHVWKIVVYFAVFGGLPWSRALHPDLAAALGGGLIWAAAAPILVRAWRDRFDTRSPLVRAGEMLVLFGLCTAVMAAIGRVDELPTPVVPTRYTPFATLLQLGVVLGWSAALDAWLRRGAALRVILASVAPAVLLIAADIHGARILGRAARRIEAAGALFDRGGRPTDVVLHPRPEFAARVRAQLHARGLPS